MVGTSALLGQGAGSRYNTFNLTVECSLRPPKYGQTIHVEAVLDDGCTHSCIGADSLDIFEWDWIPLLMPATIREADTANGPVGTLGAIPLTVRLHPELEQMNDLIIQVFPGNCPLLLGGDVLSAHRAVHRHCRSGASEYSLTSIHGNHTVTVKRMQPTVYLTDTMVGVKPTEITDLEYLQAVLGPSAEDIDNEEEGGGLDDKRSISEILLGPLEAGALDQNFNSMANDREKEGGLI